MKIEIIEAKWNLWLAKINGLRPWETVNGYSVQWWRGRLKVLRGIDLTKIIPESRSYEKM